MSDRGDSETFEVEPDCTVSRLKGMVRAELGISTRDQVVLSGPDELDDDRTLWECGVEHGDAVTMELYRVRVFWHFSGGQELPPVVVRRDGCVDAVRSGVARSAPVVVARGGFRYQGKPVAEAETLRRQGIPHGAILTVDDDGERAVATPNKAKKKFRLSVDANIKTFDD